MDGISRRAGNGRCALDHVRIAYRPFIRLLRAHGAADNQREPPEAELFRYKFVLRTYVITDTHVREIPHACWCERVVRRGRKTVANLIDDDDEIFFGIKCAAFTYVHLLYDFVRAGVPGGNKDG